VADREVKLTNILLILKHISLVFRYISRYEKLVMDNSVLKFEECTNFL
jgi:hypothetical protein